MSRPVALVVAVVLLLGASTSVVSRGQPARDEVLVPAADAALDAVLTAPAPVTPTGGRVLTRSVDLIPPDVLARFGPKPAAAPPPPGEGLAAFTGLSTWIDTYDTTLTAAEQVAVAAANGVDTLFVQVSRISTDGLIHDHERLVSLIEGAHDAGMSVMVWTIPSFSEIGRDVRRAKAAMAFVTPRGDRPDAFGLDIESTAVADVDVRTRRLLTISSRLRAWVGPDYPMAAIVLPPRQLEINTVWWPGFPYADLAATYDVMIPMSYSSFRGRDAVTTFTWNHDNVILTRQLSAPADVPVHLAGGIADDLPEVAEFVRAAQVTGVIGAGLYDLETTSSAAWAALAPLAREEFPHGGGD